MLGYLAHAQRGHNGLPACECRKDVLELTEVSAKRAVKKYAAKETAHEAINRGNAKVHAAQLVERAAGSNAWLQYGMTNGIKCHRCEAREIKRHTWTGSESTNC